MPDLEVLEGEVAAAERSAPALGNKVVVITGGSRGVGAATAQVLGLAGAKVVLADLDLPRAEERVAALAALEVESVALALDVGDEAQVRRLIRNVHQRFGRLDIIVNSAAIDIAAPIGELQVGGWERVVRTNLTGPFLTIKCALEVMTRGGRIVNIAATPSLQGWPNASAYHATKWGLLGLSHALHAELRPRGIGVCAVVAGGTRAPFRRERFPDIDRNELQDPMTLSRTILSVLLLPAEAVVPEVTVAA